MYQSLLVITLVIVLFIGYASGRVGHILGGHTKSPHHWLYGAAIILLAIPFRDLAFVPFIALIGVGVFVSDFKDFLELKIYGADEVEIKKFWGID